jgi:hypothetical protein
MVLIIWCKFSYYFPNKILQKTKCTIREIGIMEGKNKIGANVEDIA